MDYVTVAILAKDKAHVLPYYLTALEAQTWPTSQTHLYVRTNNNRDDTAAMLLAWLDKVGSRYASVFFDARDVPEPVQSFKQHEWNTMRFKVLGAIRQASVDYALARGTHYFVVDCDNFIVPDTLSSLLRTNLPVVAPFLVTRTYYSNYHYAVSENGYFAEIPAYYEVYDRKVRGLIEVAVVHCTYLIRHEYLKHARYDDGSERHEYVIFSDQLRRAKVPQYLDNRGVYGFMTFSEDRPTFIGERWLEEFPAMIPPELAAPSEDAPPAQTETPSAQTE